MAVKKKENLWELLERLDHEAGQFNQTFSEANRYFDTAATRTKSILDRQEKELHATIVQVRKALRAFIRQNGGEEPGNGNKEN